MHSISVPDELIDRAIRALEIAEAYVFPHASSFDPATKSRNLDLATHAYPDYQLITKVLSELESC